jgi:lipopolysaccharide export LptBFGC system permease protein LptF
LLADLQFEERRAAERGGRLGLWWVRVRGLRALARKEAELEAAGRLPQAVPYAVEWHKRVATPASCFALALMGVAIRRRVRWAIVRVPAVMLVIGAYGLTLRWGEQVGDAGQLAPVVAVWAPLILLAGIAAGLAAARPERQVA